MMIKNVMLIDDNKIDVFVSQKVIEKYDPKVKTRAFNNAIMALSFFKLLELNNNIKSLSLPEIILLDVNMPEMNGFNFFKEFKELNVVKEHKIAVYMLSSSICPDDIIKAQKEPQCSGYIIKPLTLEKLKKFISEPEDAEHPLQFKKII